MYSGSLHLCMCHCFGTYATHSRPRSSHNSVLWILWELKKRCKKNVALDYYYYFNVSFCEKERLQISQTIIVGRRGIRPIHWNRVRSLVESSSSLSHIFSGIGGLRRRTSRAVRGSSEPEISDFRQTTNRRKVEIKTKGKEKDIIIFFFPSKWAFFFALDPEV